VTLEIISQSKERVRHGIDWTVRAHPTVAAGIAGAAITVAGAYVALDAHNDSGDVIARPPAAARAAPVQPQAQGRQNERELARPQVPSPGASDESAGSSAPGRAPRAGGPFATSDRSDGGSSGAGGTSAGSGGGSTGGDSSRSGSSGSSGGSGDSGGGGSETAPAPPPASKSPSQPSQPEPKCVLRVDLLGNVVKVCL
jgi:hypothetical protein